MVPFSQIVQLEEMAMRGKFVVFDGCEGAGKTTMLKKAEQQLKEEGYNILRTREPGGSPFAEEIRALVFSENASRADAETLFGLFWAARRDHMAQTVWPALEKGIHVISDRFDSATFAYQIRGQ